ncbi:unnamed protein product [Polarella glacialis]|uniref:Kinesin-like protein n=1 Tax=Polarella glacialis TaxID=89957 RepID=A0A813LHG5_POLGL|nr:unnamed protein product [Polarella glacialis]
MGCGAGKKAAETDVASPDVASPNVASPSGVRWATTRSAGAKPKLAELRKLNQPGPDELLGGEKRAFAGDKGSGVDLRSGASCLEVLEKRSVLVAVRARPLNEREKTAGSELCIKFENAQGINIERDANPDMKFAFDCAMRAEIGQQEVFDRTARPLLHKVLEGYNGCLFAYGQTGSGKTWTMQGSAENKGVIPLLCAELFKEIDALVEAKNITVVCSVLEIYNERIKDLLAPEGGEGLEIRDDTTGGKGIHVDGLSEVPVKSCETVLSLITKAQAQRAVGQTNMNEHSSRSHSVVTLRVAACDTDDVDGVTLTVSKLHLIDLAGSERQKATGATGDRLKEGAQINLSLSALGNVINALTEPNKGKTRHIPYRDSKLTRLLQDSLGGNSYTVIVCNISLAKINAEETLSSLRFAERAKKIENKASVNRDPKGERIVELMQENKALKAKVDRLEAHVAKLEQHYE